MDFLAFSLGKIVCDASTAIVYAARCTDPSAMRPIGYVLLLVIAVALALSATRVGWANDSSHGRDLDRRRRSPRTARS